MTTLAAHRAAIVATLRAVANVGHVHDEEPYAREQAAFQSFYAWADGTGKKQLRGWYVVRTATRETTLGVGRVVNVHTWRIRGFMALQPPGSGVAFDDLVEAMRKPFRDDETLGGVCEPGPTQPQTGLQVVDSGPVMFTGVLCHSATLTLQTYAYLNPGE
jgi:hypothetical protein